MGPEPYRTRFDSYQYTVPSGTWIVSAIACGFHLRRNSLRASKTMAGEYIAMCAHRRHTLHRFPIYPVISLLATNLSR